MNTLPPSPAEAPRTAQTAASPQADTRTVWADSTRPPHWHDCTHPSHVRNAIVRDIAVMTEAAARTAQRLDGADGSRVDALRRRLAEQVREIEAEERVLEGFDAAHGVRVLAAAE